ncbi:DUF6705 family protein [Flavobacterium sp. A45]|uniref:DUF6705 family protein n=1 Tax=Flavobacterium sp. A45 TaxID=1945862 RepID=UPI000F4F56BF|nr:DUF6705 family protein [Flavobacterium sp. A45]
MKKLLYLSTLMVLGLTMNAQKIVPLENKYGYKIINRNEEIYFKDVNNILGKFVGTWKGTYGNKKYEFRLLKTTRTFETMKYDRLLVRYIITDLNDNVIENTTYFPDSSPYVIKGHDYHENGYYLVYVAKGGNCAQSGQILLYVDGNNMDVLFHEDSEFVDLTECPTQINEYFQQNIIYRLIKQ